MTNILMMKDIAEARELASKAGIAQLTAEYAGDMGDSEEMDAEMGVESPFFIDGLPVINDDGYISKPVALHIANAHNILPKCLDMVEKLREQLQSLAAAVMVYRLHPSPATAAESGKAEREARALLAEMEDGNATS
jgi:hypothetical protein